MVPLEKNSSLLYLHKVIMEELTFSLFQVQFSLVQFSSVTQSCPTLCDPMYHSMPGLPVHHQHPEFTQTHIHRVRDAIQPSHPLHMRQQKYWSFSFSIIPSKEIPGLIFRMDWLDHLAVQGTLKRLLQPQLENHNHRTPTTVLKYQFFCAQLSSQSNTRIPTWPLEKP